MVAISTVIVTLCVAIGPLLQKATSVTTLTTTLPVKLSGHIASGLPQGYTALLVAGEADLGGVSLEFSQVLRSIDQNKDIEYKDSGISGCEGNCSSVIQGAGSRYSFCGISKIKTSLGVCLVAPHRSQLPLSLIITGMTTC